eukprot:scaffold92610_cov45-Prasinocladus_malaysianus.AAC.1
MMHGMTRTIILLIDATPANRHLNDQLANDAEKMTIILASLTCVCERIGGHNDGFKSTDQAG